MRVFFVVIFILIGITGALGEYACPHIGNGIISIFAFLFSVVSYAQKYNNE